MSKFGKPHPGFNALAVKGKRHPGFNPVVKHEAHVARPIAPVPAPSGGIAPVAPIGPPQMPGMIPGQGS